MSRRVLVIDDNFSVLEIVTLFVESCQDCEVVGATSGNDAITILQEDSPVDLIICDYNMPNGNGADVYQFLKKSKSDIPFILQTAEPLEIIEEFSGFPYSDREYFVQKPFTLEQVTEAVNRLLTIEDTGEERYVRVSIPTFKKYSHIGVDAFLRLSEHKYVKFHHHFDELDNETVEKYEKKGINHFYIPKSEYHKFIASCQQRLEEVLLSPNVSLEELKAAQFDTTENLRSAVQTLGVDPFMMKQADQLSASVIYAVTKNKDIEDLVESMREGDGYLSQLSLMVGYVAVAMADKISWADRKCAEKLVTASIFMDLAWMEIDTDDFDPLWGKITYKDDLQMKSLDKSLRKMIKHHSVDSAKLFDKIHFDSDIYNLICDHHERPAGRGFPKGIFEQQISSLAAIFTLAHEFSSRVLLCDDFTFDQYNQIKKSIFVEFQEGHYKEPCRAFSKVFC